MYSSKTFYWWKKFLERWKNMFDRIKRAVMFKTDVYPEVSNDAGFTRSAWIILAVSYVLFALGFAAIFIPILHIYHWSVLSFILQAVLGVGAFVLGVFVIVWLAKPIFNVELKFDTLFRPLALASVFYAAGVLGLIPVIGTIFKILTPLAAFVAMVFALKAVTKLDWVKTIVLIVLMAIVVGIVMGIISAIAGVGAVGASLI